MVETVEFLVKRGVPVMGHVGLRPQAVNVTGGFRAQGRNEDERARVMKEREFAAPYDHLARVREWALESGDDG